MRHVFEVLLLTMATLAWPTFTLAGEGASLAESARAVLNDYCARCHGVTKKAGSLDVRDEKGLFGEATTGEPYLVPGKPDASLLWLKMKKNTRIIKLKM